MPSAAYLKLELAGFSITFDRFFADQIPRIDPNDNPASYTAYGTPNIQGVNYEPPCLWNVDAYCSQEDFASLLIIWKESEYRRRTESAGDFRILVIDTTFPFTERSPRTRAIAPSTVATTKSGSVDYVVYYAQFYGWISKQPVYRKLGKDWGATFTMQELDKVPA